MKTLEEFLVPTQTELFEMIRAMYRDCTTVYFCKNSYILVKGEAPIMLLAHIDTVHHEPVREICYDKSGNILMSPQGIGGDDRCGVYALNAVYEQAQIKPWLLFTCDEEIGGRGAKEFCLKHAKGKLPKELDELKMLIELDRKGKNDAVYYDCENDDFEEYITSKGFNIAFGSFSDISLIAPELKVAAVNLSSGYYNAHTLHEYINRKHLNSTIKRVVEIVEDTTKPDFPKYEYMEGIYLLLMRSKKHIPKANSCLDDVPEGVPEELHDQYLELLYFYSTEELEAFRAEYGNWIISEMYDTELGYYGECLEEWG